MTTINVTYEFDGAPNFRGVPAPAEIILTQRGFRGGFSAHTSLRGERVLTTSAILFMSGVISQREEKMDRIEAVIDGLVKYLGMPYSAVEWQADGIRATRDSIRGYRVGKVR